LEAIIGIELFSKANKCVQLSWRERGIKEDGRFDGSEAVSEKEIWDLPSPRCLSRLEGVGVQNVADAHVHFIKSPSHFSDYRAGLQKTVQKGTKLIAEKGVLPLVSLLVDECSPRT
jgi:hypothetical protein